MPDQENLDKNWKHDFPNRKQDASLLSRRDFAKFLTFISGGLMLGSGLIAAKAILFPHEKSDQEHFVCNAQDIPVGGTRSFVIEGSSTPYLMIHLEEGSFHAYEQKCTHLSCAVYYAKGTGKIACPCHEGFFNAKTGEVISGPPPRALPKLEVLVKAEKLYVREFQVV